MAGGGGIYGRKQSVISFGFPVGLSDVGCALNSHAAFASFSAFYRHRKSPITRMAKK